MYFNFYFLKFWLGLNATHLTTTKKLKKLLKNIDYGNAKDATKELIFPFSVIWS